MIHYISKFILKITGWKIIGGLPEDVKKCVVIVAPHTSMWDFVWGRMAFFELRLKAKFLIKKEAFKFPWAGLLKRMGGIPIDRSKSSNTVDLVASLFDEFESLYITVAPEGTRKQSDIWKKGFYYIALKANVPIALGILDYGRKESGIGKMLNPSGNFEEDFKEIEDFYRGRKGKHPDKFNL